MKKFSDNKYVLSALFISLFGIQDQAYAAYCPDTGDPLVISTNCYALTLLNNKSLVTVQSGVTVTEKNTGFFAPVEVRSIIDNFTNNGTIQSVLLTPGATEVSAIKIFSGSSVGKLTNNGTITAAPSGKAGLEVNGTVNVLNNSGTISGTWGANALSVSGASINTLNNSGTITAVFQGIVLESGANIGTLNNSGSIAGGINNTNTWIDGMIVRGGASIGAINNTGVMTHSATFTSPVDGHKEYFSAINNQGSIGVITNTGTIATNGGYGVNNAGTITTINNQQSDLALKGNLPANYNTIINSPSNYGKLSVTSVSGTTTFGIYQGSVIPSGMTTYAAVLSGVAATNIASTTGTYGGGLVNTTWILKNTSGNTWDLVTNPTVVTTSPTVSNSAAGSSLANQILISYAAAAVSSSTGTDSSTGSNAGSGNASSSVPTPTLQNGTTLVSAVQSLTAPEVNQLASVHAEGYSSNMTIGLEQMKTVANTVMDRIHKPVSDSNSNSVAYEIDAGRYVWADVAGFTGTVNSYNGLAGFGYNSYYGVIGLDLFRNQTGGVGIYGGAGNSYMTQSSQVSQNFNNNTGYLGMYGGMYLSSNLKLSGALGYSFGHSNAKRNNPDIGSFTGGTASDSYSSNGAFAALKLSQSMLIGEKFTLTPFVGGSYSQLNTGAVSESGGGDFNYSIKAATSYQTITFAGAEFVQPLKEKGDNMIALVGFYRFSYNWSANTDSAHTVTASNSTFGTFNQTGANMGPVSNLFGLGLQGQLSKDVSLRIGAVAAVNTHGTQYGGGGELRLRF